MDTSAIWAQFDQDAAAGNEFLTMLVDETRTGVDQVGHDRMLAGLIMTLDARPHDTIVALAALAVMRLARQQHQATP